MRGGWIAVCVAFLLSPLMASAQQLYSSSVKGVELAGLKAMPESRIDKILKGGEAAASRVILSSAWIDAQPTAKGDKHWKCLTEALYFEARGESIQGQFAVAEVILNRVKSARFPDNICAVINQGTGKRFQCQFTYTCDGLSEHMADKAARRQVGKVARAALDGKAPKLTDGATHYHATWVRPRWSRTYTRTAHIGVHIFYRHTFRTASN